MVKQPPYQQAIVGNDRVGNIWLKWFITIQNSTVNLRDDGSFSMPEIEDADAVNNSLYYSTTQGKLVYKDSLGVANALY